MYWILLVLLILSCAKTLPTINNPSLNNIYETSKIDFTSKEFYPFYPYILELKPKYVSFYISRNFSVLRIYDIENGIFIDIHKKGDQIQKIPPKKFTKNEIIFFSRFIPTPTPSPTPAPRIHINQTKKIKKAKKTNSIPKAQEVPEKKITLQPTPIKWTDDRIAMEILKGNAPRDKNGNLIHKSTGSETLAEIVAWYCEGTTHLEEISKFNNNIPVDASIVEGVEIKIPPEYVVNPKKYTKTKN